ncbi:MAG: hypothetical protein ACREE9_07675 [Stellaceae bacterium]
MPGSAALARCAGVILLVAAGCLPGIAPAQAFDLFATHEVTTQFASADGKPMANAPVRVFAPGDPTTPVETGHTDAKGKFEFSADRDGMWTAEARTPSQVARVMIRVGAGAPQQQQRSRVPPYLVIGGLILLVALAWWYRLARGRARRRPNS